MHQGPENIAIALCITWPQDSGIDSLLHGLPQHLKTRNARLAFTHLPLRQEICPLHEHELIVHRVLQTKGHIGSTECDDPFPGILLTFSCRCQLVAKAHKPLIDHGEQQVILVAKVEINGRWRVANALGHLAQREALIALLQEQFACSGQDSLAQFLLLLCLPVANRLILTGKCRFVKG